MRKIKKVLRMVVLVCLIFLACIGIGISGGVPPAFTKNRRDSEKENIELMDTEEGKSDDQKGTLEELRA
jgi:hypothetical protein